LEHPDAVRLRSRAGGSAGVSFSSEGAMLQGLRSRFTSVLAILVVSVLVVGCSSKKDDDKGGGDKKTSKVTKENSAKLKDGMTEKEVLDILGEPTEKKDIDAKEKQYTWKNGNDMIQVFFKDGKQVGKSEVFVTVK
jgi:outer membrane protein assembly factor BamE (lipoprotein component of BamABCDE complex)